MENLILTGKMEGKNEKRKQCISCIASLCKCRAQGLGEITKIHYLLRVTMTGNFGYPCS